MSSGRILILVILLWVSACTRDTTRETPTQGKALVAVDPSVLPILEEFTEVFNFRYPHASIELKAMNEAEAVNALIEGSVRMIVIPGNLPAAQNSALSQKYHPVVQPLAYDAVVLMVHPDNPDTLITLNQLRDILSGTITDWSQIRPGSTLGKIQVVLDEGGSSVYHFLMDSVLNGKEVRASLSGAGSHPEVIEQTSRLPGALGFAGLNWVAGRRDSLQAGLMEKCRFVRVQNPSDQQFYLPFQAWIGIGKYPLKRPVNAITLENRTGIIAGFISYCAGEKGQRMVLKSGLLPAYKPSRIIELR